MPTIQTYVHKAKKGKPRPAYTYRAARRNLFLKAEPREIWPGVKAKPVGRASSSSHSLLAARQNRSRHLDGQPTLSPYR